MSGNSLSANALPTQNMAGQMPSYLPKSGRAKALPALPPLPALIVQGLHCHACAVLTSCYLPRHKRCGHCQLGESSFFQSLLPMGGVNELWTIFPGLSVTSTREVKGQVKGQGPVAYTL